ncbi:M56 family metallopeptidase [Streptomyces sp. NBC_00083]|uniref:M56 family metallopeptidase n=1 Tax=Streptomyces sp. NBC_00083 TaxID=2975647 RepID=UPI002254A881|nr:M56 family metallopeptidase [Streptomyces sp. NBC_00083]MCX5388157.1 M56 family metallopeptidase [Streptomyces sp. NBC_00083]
MLISVYVPFVITTVLAVVAPRLARRLTPRPAAWALACAALVTAVGWAGSLALLAFTGIAQIPQVAAEGHWSVAAVRAQDPVYVAVAALSAIVLVSSVASLAVAAVRQTRRVLRARKECAELPHGSELTVLDDDTPLAFALPGAPGRIVVSRGMLRRLGHDERTALLAHERAHLRGRHYIFLSLWQLTAALNPLLRPLARAGAFALERWADEEAAAQIGDRSVVARAVGRAALATAGTPRPGLLAATGGEVPQRVRALLAPPPAPRSLPFVAGALLLSVCCASLANAASDSDEIVDSAKRAQCAELPATTTAPPPTPHHHTPAFHCGPHHWTPHTEHRS